MSQVINDLVNARPAPGSRAAFPPVRYVTV